MNFGTSNPHERMFGWSLQLAGVAVVALTLGGFYALVHQPLERKQAESMDRVSQLDRLLLKTGAEGREYRRLRDQLAEMQASVTELRSQLATQQPKTALIENLSGIADQVEMEVLDYQVGLTETLPTHTQTEVEFRCDGSYASICRFLEQAEQLTKTTKLANFELRPSENSRRYQIQLTFVLYSTGVSHDTKEKREFL